MPMCMHPLMEVLVCCTSQLIDEMLQEIDLWNPPETTVGGLLCGHGVFRNDSEKTKQVQIVPSHC